MNAVTTVNFHGNALYGAELKGDVFVALKPIVEGMGLAWQGQLQRVKRNPILREGITVMIIPTQQGPQNSIGLRLKLIAGWLFTISSLRITNTAVRAKIELFQR